MPAPFDIIDDLEDRVTDLRAGPAVTVLRKWQEEAIPIALAAIATGLRGVVVAIMGAGKSIAIRELIKRWFASGGVGVVVVTTTSVRLVEQLRATFAEELASVGAYYTHAKDADAQVIVCCNASAPALAAALRARGVRVGLWVADEVHRSESGGVIEAAEALDPVGRIGFTATPYRSEEGERVTLFDEVLYTYGPADALRDGVIVPWRIQGWEGDEVPVDDACVDLIRRHRDGPGVVNAVDIEDAETFAGVLSDSGVRAEAIHSRLRPVERENRIERLRVGDLDALVHVALLVEGVDLPWLRWMCLRRPVGARVRFVQEIGRVLRACPSTGKAEAVFLDPHDLFGTFGLAYEAALGWEEPEPKELREDRAAAGRDEDEEPDVRYARQIAAVASWARQLLLAMQAEGLSKQSSKVSGSRWRNDPISDRQPSGLRFARQFGRYLPAEHREAVLAVARNPEWLGKGVVSDLLNVLFALGDLKRDWTPAVPITPPSLVDDGVWRCGAAIDMTTWIASVAVLRGRKVEYSGARDLRAGDTIESLEASAERLARERFGVEDVRVGDPWAVQVAKREAWLRARGRRAA